MRKSIVLFGGAFDPIHIGHLRIGIVLRDCFGFDNIRFLPCAYLPNGKIIQTAAVHRFEMMRAVLADEACLFEDATELERARPSYSVDTVTYYQTAFPEHQFIWVIGSDQLQKLHRWHQWEIFVQKVKLLVIHRPGHKVSAHQPVLSWYHRHHCADFDLFMQQPVGACFDIHLDAVGCLLSSSYVRQAIAHGHSVRYLVPEKVARYIQQHALYQERHQQHAEYCL